MCSYRRVESKITSALKKANIAAIVTFAKNGLNRISKNDFNGEGQIYIINSFIENGIEIIQKIISPIIGEKSARIQSPS